MPQQKRVLQAHMMSSLTILLLIAVFVWFWQANLRSRDIAVQTASGSCKAQGLQLLDGTVSIKHIKPYYRSRNDFGIQRTYLFDYSGDGFSRQTGCIVLHNNAVQTVILESHPDT
ncbi:MAG: DUF3301 domain-containing protein [Gammaproteobacteria bacterium]|nr:MAG: DUF3301 domain-containing protein [Gammaproteobacteria bacterium]